MVAMTCSGPELAWEAPLACPEMCVVHQLVKVVQDVGLLGDFAVQLDVTKDVVDHLTDISQVYRIRGNTNVFLQFLKHI